MSQMRMNVKQWLETNPLEPAKMVAWHGEKYPRSSSYWTVYPSANVAKLIAEGD
jgi:hypothetical protein